MSSSKHTPGEWVWINATDTRLGCLFGGNGELVLDSPTFIYGRNEDARLIAVAPDMLEALERANIELAALVPDPTEPDFSLACKNDNPADVECLETAFDWIRTALAAAHGDQMSEDTS